MVRRLAIGLVVLAACNRDHPPAPAAPPPAVSAPASAVAAPEPDRLILAGDHLDLEDSHPAMVSAALVDLSALAPRERDLARARLWVLGNTEWGWGVVSSGGVIAKGGFVEAAAMVAKEHPKLRCWLQVSDAADHPLAMIAASGGRVTLVEASKLTVDHVPAGLARDPAELHEVLDTMGEKVGLSYELSDGRRIAATDPSPDVLETLEVWPGRELPKIEDTFYVTQATNDDVIRIANAQDSGMSRVVQRAYKSVRARILKMTAAELATPRRSGKVGMFIILPAWMHMEIEREAKQLDVSMSQIVATALELAKAPAP